MSLLELLIVANKTKIAAVQHRKILLHLFVSFWATEIILHPRVLRAEKNLRVGIRKRFYLFSLL